MEVHVPKIDRFTSRHTQAEVTHRALTQFHRQSKPLIEELRHRALGYETPRQKKKRKQRESDKKRRDAKLNRKFKAAHFD